MCFGKYLLVQPKRQQSMQVQTKPNHFKSTSVFSLVILSSLCNSLSRFLITKVFQLDLVIRKMQRHTTTPIQSNTIWYSHRDNEQTCEKCGNNVQKWIDIVDNNIYQPQQSDNNTHTQNERVFFSFVVGRCCFIWLGRQIERLSHVSCIKLRIYIHTL